MYKYLFIISCMLGSNLAYVSDMSTNEDSETTNASINISEIKTSIGLSLTLTSIVGEPVVSPVSPRFFPRSPKRVSSSTSKRGLKGIAKLSAQRRGEGEPVFDRELIQSINLTRQTSLALPLDKVVRKQKFRRSLSDPYDKMESRPDYNAGRRRSSAPEDFCVTPYGFQINKIFESEDPEDFSDFLPSPRGPNPLSDLQVFKHLKELVESQSSNDLTLLEDFVKLSYGEKVKMSMSLGGGEKFPTVYMAPLILKSKNLFNIENLLQTRFLLPVLDTPDEAMFNVFYAGTGLSPNCTVQLYYFFTENNHSTVKLSLPCVNKVGGVSTLHDELARTLRNEALYAQQTKGDTILINSFSRPNKFGLISPFNGALDIIRVSDILHRASPKRGQFFFGESWGGSAVDITDIEAYYNFLHPTKNQDNPHEMKPKLILTLNALPMVEEQKSQRFLGTLRVNIHGENDNLFRYEDAETLAKNNGSYTISVPGAGHNFNMFTKVEGKKESTCFDFREICVTFQELPTLERTVKFNQEYLDIFKIMFRLVESSNKIDFTSIPSLQEENIKMSLRYDDAPLSWPTIVQNYVNAGRIRMVYGASEVHASGVPAADLAIISIAARLAKKVLGKDIADIPSKRIASWLSLTATEKRYLRDVS